MEDGQRVFRPVIDGAPLASVKARVKAGEPLDEVARDYELDRHELERALRIADPVAA